MFLYFGLEAWVGVTSHLFQVGMVRLKVRTCAFTTNLQWDITSWGSKHIKCMNKIRKPRGKWTPINNNNLASERGWHWRDQWWLTYIKNIISKELLSRTLSQNMIDLIHHSTYLLIMRWTNKTNPFIRLTQLPCHNCRRSTHLSFFVLHLMSKLQLYFKW